MLKPDLFRLDDSEAPALLQRERPAPAAFQKTRCLEIEFTSRGDRVPGRLLMPDSGGPFPLLLLLHGAQGSKDAAYLDMSARWVAAGTAVATLDLPLHGARSSAKLSQKLHEALDCALSGKPLDRPSSLLWTEFVRQAVADQRRCIDALSVLAVIDATRVAFAGISLGAICGAPFCAIEDRIAAAALMIGGGGFGPPEVDPCAHIAAMAPRPLLVIGAEGDERVARSATEALFASAAHPKEIAWFPGGHQELPGAALKLVWNFLGRALQLN